MKKSRKLKGNTNIERQGEGENIMCNMKCSRDPERKQVQHKNL